MSKGDKFDAGKPRMSLIDPFFLEQLALTLTFGAQKYGTHNWRQGIEMDRLLDAALRHINSFNDGHDLDEESGHPHLAHAAACLMMAMAFTNTKLDNRYRGE